MKKIGFLSFGHWSSSQQSGTRSAGDALLQSIVGLQIEITRLVGKRKLSQTKAADDIRGAADALIANGQVAIGDAMLEQADAKRQ